MLEVYIKTMPPNFFWGGFKMQKCLIFAVHMLKVYSTRGLSKLFTVSQKVQKCRPVLRCILC